MTLAETSDSNDPDFDDPDSDTPTELARAEARRRRAVFGIVGAFLAILVSVMVVQWVSDSEDQAQGDPLPEAALTTLDGDEFMLTSIIGQPTVLNFFASWCAPCRAEMPAFQEVSLAVAPDVQFLGINTLETDVAQARDLVASTGITYTVALGDDGELFEEVGGLAMPTTAFVNTDGVIVEVHSGVLSADDLRAKIEEHFG